MKTRRGVAMVILAAVAAASLAVATERSVSTAALRARVAMLEAYIEKPDEKEIEALEKRVEALEGAVVPKRLLELEAKITALESRLPFRVVSALDKSILGQRVALAAPVSSVRTTDKGTFIQTAGGLVVIWNTQLESKPRAIVAVGVVREYQGTLEVIADEIYYSD